MFFLFLINLIQYFVENCNSNNAFNNVSTSGAGTTRHPDAKRKKSRHKLYITKINSKWIIDLNVKYKTIKLLEDSLGEYLDNLGYGNDFLGTIQKAWSMKEITDNLDLQFKISALPKTTSRDGKISKRLGENICRIHFW